VEGLTVLVAFIVGFVLGYVYAEIKRS